MRSPVLAMLWENWRLTRLEAANRLALGIVGAAAVLVLFAAVAPNEAARDVGATITLGLIIFMTFPLWLSISKLKGGRFLDGYRPGFPLSLLYARPVRTAVLVGVPMAYLAALAAAVYLVSALVLRWTFGYPFPLLPVAALIAAAHLAQAAGDWSTRSKVVQWLGTMAPVMALGSLAMYRWEGWPALFDFSLADYALIAAIGLVSFGVAVAGVARQRRGDAKVATPWTAASARIPGAARHPVPVPVPHLVTDAGAGVVRLEVQWTAGAGDRSGARDRDSAVVRGHHPTRCRALRVLRPTGHPRGRGGRGDVLPAGRADPRGQCLWHSRQTRTDVRQRIRSDPGVRNRADGRPQGARALGLPAGRAPGGRHERLDIRVCHPVRRARGQRHVHRKKPLAC